MLHYRIHGFLLTELTVRKAFQGYVFSLEHWESSNEKIASRQYLKDGFSPFSPPLTTPLRRSIKIVGHKAFGTSLLHNIKKLWTLDCRTSFVRYTFLQIWIKNNKNAEKNWCISLLTMKPWKQWLKSTQVFELNFYRFKNAKALTSNL